MLKDQNHRNSEILLNEKAIAGSFVIIVRSAAERSNLMPDLVPAQLPPGAPGTCNSAFPQLQLCYLKLQKVTTEKEKRDKRETKTLQKARFVRGLQR